MKKVSSRGIVSRFKDADGGRFAILTPMLQLKRRPTGQTMGEYALILAAVAVVAYVGYQVLGNDISDMMTSLGSTTL